MKQKMHTKHYFWISKKEGASSEKSIKTFTVIFCKIFVPSTHFQIHPLRRYPSLSFKKHFFHLETQI